MSPRTLSDHSFQESPVLREDAPVGEAVAEVLSSGLPALPVVGQDGKYVGIFGEREFIGAIFPGYLGQLHYAGFIPKNLESQLEKRAACRREPVSQHMNREHVDVGSDFGDSQLAETFLHHRVLIIPIVDDGEVKGVVTRSDFFRALATRFVGMEEQ